MGITKGGYMIMANKRVTENLSRDLFVLEDENNPDGSKMKTVWASTILDQVFDDQSPTKKTLREILADLHLEIISGGKGNISFPVNSVNEKTGDVVIKPRDIGLENVDNTRDMDKPLSEPQRTSVMNILKYYDFNVDLKDLYEHISSFDNPHNITVSQLDNDGKLSNLIQKYVKQHNQSTDDSVHMDIRNSINRLSERVDDIITSADNSNTRILDMIGDHLEDANAHQDIFDKKEDISNKVLSFTTTLNKDHTKYPSTRAVVEFVESQISTFKETLPDIRNWIDDIGVIDSRDDLPPLSSSSHRKSYLIRHGNSSHDEIAVCRLNPDGETYSWDITPLGTYSKFDPKYFIDTIDGLSINLRSMMDAIIGDNGMLDTSLAETLEGYYTKDEIDKKHFVDSITILPGTMDGHIRYYINDNLETMSDDVKVPGLKRLAYLEWITENELWDQSVHERHILSKSVATRHIQDRAVTADKLFTSPEANMVMAVIDPNTDPVYTKIVSRMIGEGEIDATKIRSSDEDNRVLGVLKAGRAPIYTTINHHMLEENIIYTAQLLDRCVTTAKLADNAITSEKLAAGAINSSIIGSDAVGTDHIKDESVSTIKIIDKAITTEKLATNSVTTDKIKDSSIVTDKIADNAITTEKITDSSITNSKISDSAITYEKMADDSIGTNNIINNSVTTDKILASAVTTDKIADKNITTEKLNDSAVTTEKINDSAVTTDKINNSAVTTEKIRDNAITTDKISDSSITTSKISDNSITNDKLDNRSVNGRTLFTSPDANRVLIVQEASTDPIWGLINQYMIGDLSIDTRHIMDLSIINSKMSDDSVDTRNIVDESVTNSKLGEASVSTSKIVDQSVITDKLADSSVTNDKIHERSVDQTKITCTWDHVIGNIENENNNNAHEIRIEDLALSLKRFRIPANLPTHLWKPNTEYSLDDESYGCRFKGRITSKGNKRVTSLLSSQLNTASYYFVEAGGTWVYRSDPDGWISLTASGEFTSFIRMEHDGLYLETLSPDTRIDAKYDVWVKYTKHLEVTQPIDPDGDFLEDPILQCDKDCEQFSPDDIASMWNNQYTEEDTTDYTNSLCIPLTRSDIQAIYNGEYEEPDDDGVECNSCDMLTANDVRIMYGLEPIESDGSINKPIATSLSIESCSGNCETCNSHITN